MTAAPGSIAAVAVKVGQRGAERREVTATPHQRQQREEGSEKTPSWSPCSRSSPPPPPTSPPVHGGVQDDKELPIKSRFIDCKGHERGFMVVPQRWDRFFFGTQRWEGDFRLARTSTCT